MGQTPTTITVTLDEQGNIVVPAALRKQLRIETGTTLVAETDADGDAHLRAQTEIGRLVDEDGLLVFTGALQGDIEDLVQRARDERIQQLVRTDQGDESPV